MAHCTRVVRDRPKRRQLRARRHVVREHARALSCDEDIDAFMRHLQRRLMLTQFAVGRREAATDVGAQPKIECAAGILPRVGGAAHVDRTGTCKVHHRLPRAARAVASEPGISVLSVEGWGRGE